MNVKRSLENRIRGWFPKEPNPSKPIQRLAQPSSTNQEMASPDINSFDQRTLFFISLPLLFIACYFAFGDFSYGYKIAWQIIVVGFVLGFIAGMLISFPITKKELEWLSQKGKISGRVVKLSILPLIAAIIGIFLVLLFYYSGQGWVFS